MTANESTPTEGHESIARKNSLVDLRVAGPIVEIESCDPMGGGNFRTGMFTPEKIKTNGNGSSCNWMVDDGQLTERTVEIYYDREGVHVVLEGKGDDVHGDAKAMVDVDQAREFAAALYQAAEELDRRPKQ